MGRGLARRLSRRGEAGSQSLEWIGLGSFVLTAMVAGAQYAQHNLGGTIGELLINHLKSMLGS